MQSANLEGGAQTASNLMPGEPSARATAVTMATLRKMKREGEKVAVLTAYDASFANLLENAGVEVILVGDSLGNVVQGRSTTLPVTVDDMVYHTSAVRRGCSIPLLIADLPFLSYATPDLAIASAMRLMQEGHAQMVKLEGGAAVCESVRLLTGFGVPVCGHLGLTPQSVYKLGGYRVQGRRDSAAEQMIEDALALQEAGLDMLVAECVPSSLGSRLSETLEIPVIGIGAGPDCDAQVLVLYDMLGITPKAPARFVRNFMSGESSVLDAVRAYVRAVKSRDFPGPENSY
jgi:3-methyl-2-oxobutanoate hydroxymethyltransferase